MFLFSFDFYYSNVEVILPLNFHQEECFSRTEVTCFDIFFWIVPFFFPPRGTSALLNISWILLPPQRNAGTGGFFWGQKMEFPHKFNFPTSVR